MTKEVSAKASVPFFITKEAGNGTGLGLSQVYGFVKQSGGHVKIYSEFREGTTVKLCLPRSPNDPEEIGTPGIEPSRAVVSGNQTGIILPIEDDDDVRANTVAMLRELG
jgi:hypothetical protein